MARKKISRRDFVADAGKLALGAAAAPGFPMIVPRHVLGGPGYRAPSDIVNFAVVGFGGMGSGNAQEMAKTEQLVAVCDVDQAFAKTNVESKQRPNRDGVVNPAAINLKAQFERAPKYTDFREMLDKQKDIDGVVVATPDHNHAVVAKAAMDLGKHVYVQKPLTWSVHEARVLARDRDAESEARHADGQSGSLEGRRASDQRMDSGWRDRTGARGARLDESSARLLAAGHSASAAGCRATQGSTSFGTSWNQSRVNRTLAEGDGFGIRCRTACGGICISASRRGHSRITRSTTRSTGAAGSNSVPAHSATWART